MSLSKMTDYTFYIGQHDIGDCKNNHPYSSIKHTTQPQQRKSDYSVTTDESQASSMVW
jgi:hypothetical protein